MPKHLQVLLGRQRGRVYTLDRDSFVVGRDAACDLVLDSDIVSRRHARLAVDANVKVTDLESRNGTYIDGARVHGEGTVLDGNVLLVGDVALRLHSGPAPALSPTRPDVTPGSSVNLTGSLLEIPPATLLRYLAVIKKTGMLALTSPPLQAEISFTRGHISEVFVDSRKARSPLDTLTAVLRWKGVFEVCPPSTTTTTLLLGLDALIPGVGSSARPSLAPPRR